MRHRLDDIRLASRGIWDRQRGHVLVAFLLAILIVAPAVAQVTGKAMSAGALPKCNSAVNYGVVYDATNATTLGSGGGTAWVNVSCATGSWAIEEVAAVADLGAYLPVSGTTAAAIVIQGSGAGNDVSLIAVDDIFLTPTDALTAVAGGAVTLTATTGTAAIAASAGAVTVTAVGATNDVTLTAADDVILAPTDALTGTVGGAIALTTTAGAIGLTAGGTTQDITLTSVDDIILAPTDALTGTIGGAVAVTTTAGAITLTAGGTTQDISLISVDQVILDGEGGADELTIDAASTTVIGAFKLTGASAPPVACAAGTAGTMYYDSDINKTCICNATNYVLMNDDSTTTGCS